MRDFLWIFLVVYFLHHASFLVQTVIACVLVIRMMFQRKWFLILVFVLLLFRANAVVPLSADLKEVTGKVVQLYEQSFLMETHVGNVLVVCDEMPRLDSQLQIQGDFKPTETSPHFFTAHHVAQTIVYPKSICILEEKWTLRSWVQHRIQSIDDKSAQSFMMKLLLRCSTSQDTSLTSVVQLSFLLHMFSRIFRSFLNEKWLKRIEVVLILILSALWNIPETGLRLLYFRWIKKSQLSKIESLGMYCILQFFLDPNYVQSASFWFSVLIRFSFLCFMHRKTGLFWSVVMCQLCFFASCDIVQILFMPLQQIISLCSLALCLLRLIIPFSLSLWIHWIDSFYELIPAFELHGTCSMLVIIVLLLLISSQKKSMQTFLAVSSIGLCAFCSFNLFPRIVFLNVGQGDSILIHAPLKNMTVLIDTGPPSSAVQLKNSLFAQSVYEIDLLICTHDDLDHSGNIDEVKKQFHVKEVWDNSMDKATAEQFSIVQINKFDLDSSENDRSLILTFTMNGLSFLLSGDASATVEEKAIELLDETIDVCKIAHHGSDTSTSMKFLDKAYCTMAIISAAVDNRYGHPHQEVLQRLKTNGSTVLSTQNQGDIAIVMTRFFNLVTTSNHEFGIINRN